MYKSLLYRLLWFLISEIEAWLIKDQLYYIYLRERKGWKKDEYKFIPLQLPMNEELKLR